MRILQICAAYKPAYIYGGPTMSISMLAEQLVKASIYTEVYATTANGKEELQVAPGKPQNIDGVSVTYFRRFTKDHTHFSPGLLAKLWKSCRQFDVVHINAWWNTVSVLSCLIALIRGVPVFVSSRGTLSSYSFQNKNSGIKGLIHRLIGRPLLNRCYIHVTSNREEEGLVNIINPYSFTTIPNFVKLPFKEFTGRKSGSLLRLIFLSRIEKKKGLDLLMEALPQLTIPYHLTIAGDGETDYINSLKSIANKHNVAEHITWTGFMGEDKFNLLYNHDLLVLPSYDENFGNVVIESLSQGTAVLLSPFVGLQRYVAEHNFGWECSLDATNIADRINFIYSQQDELMRIRDTAPVAIRSDFDGQQLVSRYISMYSSIITTGGHQESL
ncbi:XrtY-associated glycosyltransferase XYAG1 [Mucilaginibacter sp. L3T2-6]|uniref:XrtY-associated glycosyltransferase XYAG1 n=1 Tax=Mucilaginibacter sp. L3T2-6 TaxID=3062491 RepID=UPI002676FF27|nr:glycosyltransferase [Mucilaginibacter sp. L3T2-6]MDO3643068.1 glycosyltransferase [Mucilaginibacter sp. L3T2-6]MDV6215835.1 glycosyltransferase [Mucilaginibacter sp. L3T2-6]